MMIRPHIRGFKWLCPPHSSESERKRQVLPFMYAVIKTGGKQYKVQQGDIIFVEKLDVADGAEVVFDEVLMVENDGEMKIGNPIEGATVTGKAVKTGKGKKITVFTYRPKKDSKRKLGHRQPYTKVQIDEIKA